MKFLLEFFMLSSFGRMFELMGQIIKSYCARFYTSFIDSVRNIYVAILLTIACLLLLLMGFLLLHVALFLYLPWEMSDKILLIFVLGMVYLLGSLILVLR